MKKKYIVSTICLIIFLFITVLIILGKEIRIDAFSQRVVSNYTDNNIINNIMRLITNLGSSIWLILITILSFIIINNKKISIAIASNLILVTLLNNIIKIILHRDRPEYMLIEERGYSYPSGHAMVSMAFYGFLIFLIYRYIKNKKLKISLITIISLIILLIGISRIYFGVHYTSDVIGGFSFSICYLIIYIHFIIKYIEKNNI